LLRLVLLASSHMLSLSSVSLLHWHISSRARHPLLRSLIDTTVLAIWIAKYASEEAVADSVAHLSTTEIWERHFDASDKNAFAFLYEPIKGTDHLFYRDVLHPSTHGDSMHIIMRIRDEGSSKTWVRKCCIHTHAIYCHFLFVCVRLQMIPEEYVETIRLESAQSLHRMKDFLTAPQWKEVEAQLSL
jgi:hypothetical protein